jgi:DNA invertase Pin-like site-specific DNA recombinase
MQLRELREYAEHRDLAIVKEYVDRMTGSKDSRPSLNRLMADAGQRKFDAVLRVCRTHELSFARPI